ncbi:DEKNAAC102657 [Brettanomyces naardenensis]|uniref:DEKNAAC102657 n=1 Tax=Brettanomyces naardenensis TaxID=13370 RepID=A0A448YLD0_BRENA|nr:DEKNAAC102657 [Brettanomyces naardenensis]
MGINMDDCNCPKSGTDEVIQALGDPAFKSYNLLRNRTNDEEMEKILEVYAFGNIGDYYAHQHDLIDLSADQLNRLRQLTLISLCNGKDKVTFGVISKELRVPEDEVIKTLVRLSESSVISFRIDQLEGCILVDDIRQSRDLLCSQDKPLRMLDDTNISDMTRLINYLKFFRDVKLAKTQNAFEGKEAETSLGSGYGVKRPLEG